ncbi:MAG: heavy-metal-associated domain-containing protein [Desulfobacterales bacterium]|nr:MAG: heavy-metal-associated domain-containing protein [Desulfobacterales bacterium]
MRDGIPNNSMPANYTAGKISEDETQMSSGVGTLSCCGGVRNQTARVDHTSDQHPAVELTIWGMHCGSCVGRVETALAALDGVADASVDIVTRKATVQYNPSIVDIEDLKAAVTSAGYEIAESEPQDLKTIPQSCEQPVKLSNPRAYLFGVLASFAIVGLYLGMNTLTSDWYFARVQFSEYRWWIISLAVGLGIQVSLYTLFRDHRRGKKKTAANSSMAASSGVSVVAMMACCSHYLATVIPLLGVSFLSATAVASLGQYQPYFFLAGIVSCLFGIGFMARMMRKHGVFLTGGPKVNAHHIRPC